MPHPVLLLLQAFGITGKIGLSKDTCLSRDTDTDTDGKECKWRWYHAVPPRTVAKELGFAGVTLVFDFIESKSSQPTEPLMTRSQARQK